MEGKTVEERKALCLIELRNYELIKREDRDGNTIFVVRPPGEKKAIIFCVHSRLVGVNSVRKMNKILDEFGIETGIMVANTRYSAMSKKEAKKYGIELIPGRFPPMNIFRHELVPRHEILSSKEADSLLKEYKMSKHQLPQIKKTDIAIIAIGAKVGDIVKIARNSPTAGEFTSYRLVVP
ncbi:MAG: DNA-directed RNA polymerase subunit H [Promethearchaeota archaeon]